MMELEDVDGNDSAAANFYRVAESGLAGDSAYHGSTGILAKRKQKNYLILCEADVKKRLQADINRVAIAIAISKSEACVLLIAYKWNIDKVYDEWFRNEEMVRKAVSLPVKIELPNENHLTCGICYENYSRSSFHPASCGHPFCDECWRAYVRTAIQDGANCLVLRCPHLSCTAAVGPNMINLFADDAKKKKYDHLLCRSYVEDNIKRKWCPGPGCEFAIEIVADSGCYDVNCTCAHEFCWNCYEEPHYPADCTTVKKWTLKNSKDSANTTWLINNSKPCPACKRSIEKNNGCMHMRCGAPCNFEFCWLCLGPWSEHNDRTGGFYDCNRYEAARREKKDYESKSIREMAKNSVERYTHYFERWDANRLSRQKALEDIEILQNEKLEKLSNLQRRSRPELQFIIDALLQIAQSRRVLGWTYAHGYYLQGCENANLQFFERLQGEAESCLERLHECAEEELGIYLEEEHPSEDFMTFHEKLTALTGATRDYFKNLIEAMESGLI